MSNLPEPGDIVDEMYRIEDKIGEGGFGAVYLATHLPMDREVALKLLTTTMGAKPGEMAERFRREVMAIRNLSHPNTVRIFDFRDNEDGLLYYTMEYLRGLTLKDLIKTEGPSSPRRVARIVKQILKSLAEAHSIGIVHRDLKPANIVLADMHGETDFVKVLDFGIAKLMDQQEDDEEQLTSAGMLVGTLHYMAPEQITGLPLGPFTDIYALGLIMAHMLTGRSLFSGVQRWDILQLQIGDEMLPFDEQIASTPLGQIAVKALQKKSEDRYQTCGEMIEAIEAIATADLSPLPLVGENSGQFMLSSDSNISAVSGVDAQTTGAREGERVTVGVDAEEDAFAATIAADAIEILGPDGAEEDGATVMAELPSAGAPVTAGVAEEAPPLARFDSRFDTPAIEDYDPPKGNNTGIILGVLAVLIASAVGVAVMLSQKSEEPKPEPPPVAVKAPPEVKPEPKPEPKTEPEVKVEAVVVKEEGPKLISVSTPGLEGAVATVYVGEKIVGQTPYKHVFEEPVTLRFVAEGYATAELPVDENSPDSVGVVMQKQLKAAKNTRTTPRKTPKTDPPKTDTPKTDPPKTDPPKKGDGWLDVGKKGGKKDDKKDDKKVDIW